MNFFSVLEILQNVALFYDRSDGIKLQINGKLNDIIELDIEQNFIKLTEIHLC